ncbi:VOC family protein [Empedobacter brevis]|uniref:VOC family protein n=1 Tax=Empedobacter brevis TaxID=247 RepID=A0AAJ1QC91_9FLAO|nr:VOC family protein [Empedobacter brevis]MDM1071383.1 VOC family protein [Empedobacter brevis]
MQFRSARHTNRIKEIETFYTKILNLDILGDFKNHNGYDGLFIGKANTDWHLEFTTSSDDVNHQFDEDDCLVFYPETQEEYEAVIKNLEFYRIEPIQAKNPYWNINGISFLDPDGFVVIVSSLRIK